MVTRLRVEFVEHIPEQLHDGVLYVSMRFGTVVHRCACGCGEEVVTPLGPVEWRLTYDGRTISLTPSIGNWSFQCRSHYWIDEGVVRWARGFTGAEVARVREDGRTRRDGYYGAAGAEAQGSGGGKDARWGVAAAEVGRGRLWRWVAGKIWGVGRSQRR